jgi:hypothetical protein
MPHFTPPLAAAQAATNLTKSEVERLRTALGRLSEAEQSELLSDFAFFAGYDPGGFPNLAAVANHELLELVEGLAAGRPERPAPVAAEEWLTPEAPAAKRARKPSIIADLKRARRAGAAGATLPSGVRVSFEEPSPPASNGASDEVEAWFRRHAH